ncbi:iscS [Symbiodinium pilosum]|uniref:IscS protein n=1 Tax=Symbiodinium pilosum TaxID=2952 RepID=A0A812U0E9_SYMPI|nr:iscS [Symbiodinium pilosum]
MADLTVNLISGREVEANLKSFEGNGAELREQVGCALRITPHRLRLLTADNQEIKDADVIVEGIKCPITATVGEGQEIGDFCQEKMADFESKLVEDALNLPPGTEELSDGILLGRVMMLAIKKEEGRIWKKYRKVLKEHRFESYDFDPEEEDWESVGQWRLHIKESRRQAMKPHWQEAHDGLKKCKQAAHGFVELDKRLQQPLKLQFYCRWEEHETNGQKKKHRVYGIRQAYAAVEFSRLFGRWLELEGQFNKAASTCILSAWRDRITTVIEVERETSAPKVLKMFHTYCDLLTAAHAGHEAAAWIKPHTKATIAALLKGLSKEAFMLRAAAGVSHPSEEDSPDSVQVITESMEQLQATAPSVDGLKEGLWEFLAELAEDRCDPMRFLGMRLLTQYHAANEETHKLFQKQSEFDWFAKHPKRPLSSAFPSRLRLHLTAAFVVFVVFCQVSDKMRVRARKYAPTCGGMPSCDLELSATQADVGALLRRCLFLGASTALAASRTCRPEDFCIPVNWGLEKGQLTLQLQILDKPPRSPNGTPPYGRRGLDGSEEGQARRFVDYKMEAAPSWNGEHPESEYREYARNLKLWLIEAEARLPPSLTGKRILDVIFFGSRLAASLAHLSVDDITAPDGYKQIIAVIEESHAYLKEARLEQAFDAAIFRGRRRPGQTLTGFLATKKAAFAELKKQGLDMLATDAGNHLLGHLLLKQGGFTVDQQQRIRVLTDGSIDFRKIELAIRKIFGDSLDDSQAKTYWEGTWHEGDGDESGEYDIYFGNDGQNYDRDPAEESTIFEDLLDLDADTGEVYMVLEHDPPDIVEEAEAVEFMGDYLAPGVDAVRGHKGRFTGKGKDYKGKGSKGTPGVFGVYGSYQDYRRALQDARNGRGFDRRPRLSVNDLMADSVSSHEVQAGPPSGGQSKPTTAMFFVEPPQTSAAGYMSMTTGESDQQWPQYMLDSLVGTCALSCFNTSCGTPGPVENLDFLSYNFATSMETPGRALVDTDGGTVRGVCGAEERTPIAYIPIGRFYLRLRLVVWTQAANALMIVAQQPQLRDVRRLAARRERLERQVLDMQQKEAELMEASRRTSSGKVPMLNTNIIDETGQQRPLAQHLGRSQYLAPVLRQSPTCTHTTTSHGCNRDWSWTKCDACGAIEQIPKLTPDRMTDRDNYRDELDNADCRTTTDDDHAIGAYDPDVDGHSGTTESYPNIWRQPAADSVFGTIDGKNNSGGYRTFERPTLGRADAPNRGDGATATSPTARPRCESEFEIGTPDSQAIPPPTLAGDWEHDKEMMEDALNLLMPGAAPTRSCTKCLVGELVLNWREGKQKYLWICQRGGPSCEFVWTDWIELNSVMAAFEPIGGLQEEDTADEIGLSFESLEMLATLVDPANSYVWAFTGKTVPRTRNAVLKSPRAARVIFNVDEGDVNVLDIAKTHAVDYPLGDEEVTVYVLQEFKADFVQELDDVRHDPIEVTLDKNVKKELLTHLSLLSGGQDDDKYWEACISEHVELQSEYHFMRLDLDSGVYDGRPSETKAQVGKLDANIVDAEATIIFYGWDKYELATRPEGDHQTFAETFDISTQEKRAIPLPAATPRTYDFNVVIGIDVLFVHGLDNKTEHPVLNVTCLGTLYSTFGMIDPLRRDSGPERLGHPTSCFTGGDFQSGLERMCIQPIVCDQDAPWENGVCERRGDLFKKVYYKSRELAQPRDLDEVELLIFESAWALQTTINRSGFTPAQRVLGRQPRVALDLTSDDRHYELAVTQDKAWTRASELRDAARRALMELDAKERLQRANRGRPRRKLETRVFTEGQPVVVWRQGRRGALAKVGPCFVILQRGSTVWVTRRGELWKCDASQVFEMGPLEVQGIEVIPKDLLMAKERLRFDSEKLGFVDVSQENQPDKEERYEEEDPAEPTKLRTAAQHGLPREDGEDADLPSDAEGYSPDEIPKRPEQAQTEGPVVTTRPATKLKQGRERRNHRGRRGNDLLYYQDFRNLETDNQLSDTGEVIEDEEFTGYERPRHLSRSLPAGPVNLETILYYRPRPGHPDPGTAVNDTSLRGTSVDEDKRLFDKGLKRVHDGSGHQGHAQPKSKIGGMWIADVVTPWGDKRKYPMIANSRDLSVFGKLQKNDVLYTYSELHSGWICLTKKSGKELQERTLNDMEKRMFAEAKLTEIQNLEGSSAIEFVTDPDEIRKIQETFSHRIVPSRFILTKKQQEVGQSWKAKARWILLGHRDPDAQELERYAPTPATPTVYLTFQLLSSLRYRMVIMDVSSAFGQSDHRTREQGPSIYKSSGEYLGRTVYQTEDFEIQISMERYIQEKLKPIVLPRDKVKDEDCILDGNETTLVRGAGGSLLWIGREARPDMGAACAMAMSFAKEGPKVRNVKWINKAIAELKNTSDTRLRILPIPLQSGIWMVFTDASLGNAEGDKSQGGFLLAFVDKEIIDGQIGRLSINSWKSHRLRRAVKASLGAEALALDDGLAELEWVKALYCEIAIPGTCVNDGSRYGDDETVAVIRVKDEEDSMAVTDARALYDLWHRRSGAAGLCRRAQLDVAVMRKSAEVLKTKLYWLPGEYMVADALTKRLGNSSLLRWGMATCQFAVTKTALSKLWMSPSVGCKTVDSKLQSCVQEGP